jgi:hypothetical protein
MRITIPRPRRTAATVHTAARPVPTQLVSDLLLAMVHTDGHVGAVTGGNKTETEEKIRSLHDLLRRAGVQGWGLQRLTVAAATRGYACGQTCSVCAIVLRCGCSLPRVLCRQCPHDSAERIHRLAHQTGYCSNDDPAHSWPPL